MVPESSAPNRPNPSLRARPATMVSFLLATIGVAVLQFELGLLWAGLRSTVGLAMPTRFPMPSGEERIPHLGFWIYFFPLAILATAALLRFAETRPRALAGLAVDTSSLARWSQSLALLIALYGGLGAIAAVTEHLFFHHFSTGPAQHLVILTILLGLAYAGQRRPFLNLGPGVPQNRRRQRIADIVSLVLSAAMYASWVARGRTWSPIDQLDGWGHWLFIVATVPLACLLGWAFLHGSLAQLGARGADALERRFDASAPPQSWGWSSAAAEWLSHFGVAALLLAFFRLLWQWVQDHWPADASTTVLGVDWYFVDIWSVVTAAEVVVMGSVGVLAGLAIHRSFLPPTR